MEPEGTDLQSAAFDHFAIPPLRWCRKQDLNPQALSLQVISSTNWTISAYVEWLWSYWQIYTILWATFPLPIMSHRRFDFIPYPSSLSQDATTRSLGKLLKSITGVEPVSIAWKATILTIILHGQVSYSIARRRTFAHYSLYSFTIAVGIHPDLSISTGLEPVVFAVTGRHDNQLHQETK